MSLKSSVQKINASIILFISIVYFGVLAAPGATWVNTDCDSFIYITAAKFHTISHPVGAPLYNAINNLIIKIPFGNEFWRLAMISVICSAVTAMLLYLISTRYVKGWKTLIAPIVFMASGLVVSQSTIVETYAMGTMFAVLAFWLHLEGRNKLKYVVGGLGIAVHPIVLFTLIPIVISDWWNSGRDIKSTLKNAVFTLSYLPFLAYLVLANNEPFIWSTGDGVLDYFLYISAGGATFGGITLVPTGDMICRIQDFFSIFFVGFLLSLVLIIPGIIRSFKEKQYLLFSLFILPIILYLSCQPPQTYVYIMPSFAFGGILAIKGIEFYKGKLKFILPLLVLISSVGLMVYNTQVYAIGKNLDENLAAEKYYESLSFLEPDAVVWSSWRQWEGCAIVYYNRINGTNIYPIGFPGMVADWENEGRIATPEFLKFCRTAAVEGRLYSSISVSSVTKEAYLVKIDLEEFEAIGKTNTYWRNIYCDIRAESCYIPSLPSKNPFYNAYMINVGGVELTRWECHTESNKTFMFFFNLISIGALTGYGSSKAKDRRRKIILMILGLVLIFGVGYIMTYAYQAAF